MENMKLTESIIEWDLDFLSRFMRNACLLN